MEIVLASQSPRRKEILEEMGYSFLTEPARGDEILDESMDLNQRIEWVAYQKAKEVQKNHEKACIIAADTVVVYGNEILGKPSTKEEAADYLADLSGEEHQVKTGVCILFPKSEITFTETTSVYFKELSDAEILSYVQKGTCMDKAGAYGIQECDFVEKIKGSYSNVVGLPKEKVQSILEEFNVKKA